MQRDVHQQMWVMSEVFNQSIKAASSLSMCMLWFWYFGGVCVLLLGAGQVEVQDAFRWRKAGQSL